MSLSLTLLCHLEYYHAIEKMQRFHRFIRQEFSLSAEMSDQYINDSQTL